MDSDRVLRGLWAEGCVILSRGVHVPAASRIVGAARGSRCDSVDSAARGKEEQGEGRTMEKTADNYHSAEQSGQGWKQVFEHAFRP